MKLTATPEKVKKFAAFLGELLYFFSLFASVIISCATVYFLLIIPIM